MPMIYKRFTDKTAEEWRQIYKSLQLLEFLCKNGSERVIDDARSHLSLLRMLRQFHYIDPNGKDQGVNVRNRTNELVKLLSDVDAIRQERKKARVNKNKYGGVEGGMGMGGFSSGGGSGGGGRYGGFGSESADYGGYTGEVYGDGGGFGGQERDVGFAGTQRRGEQFEEYDEGDDVQPTTRPSRSTAATSRSTATTSAKREAPAAKPKIPQPDLFDFDDEPVTTSVSGKAPAIAAPVVDDDDDFDDFQSATPSAAQPSVNPLAALSPPPPTTSTTTSSTQFAQPKPLAPGQSAGFNNILSTASPAPSATSSILSPSASTTFSPPAQHSPAPAFPASSGYKATGPNYFTSVPLTPNQTLPSATSSTSAFQRPGMTTSYASSTSAASLGKPAPKAASSSSGGDAFGSLWSTASSAAGVNKAAASSKGPDLASLSKAKSQAGIWGAASAASAGGSGSPAPSSNTAAKPATPLGNGLDDLLG
ncbi:hypothetical protein LTR84_013003 [Exophiala bonariae]|uniref:ENTH domain-containing protein n=1 Tax=Exophiala bonariae TaxID=1690606 RepID=A0AAV9NHD2_9EURO|nr:hypothetical protein LTR84_013003 [Exophiala bonariae]